MFQHHSTDSSSQGKGKVELLKNAFSRTRLETWGHLTIQDSRPAEFPYGLLSPDYPQQLRFRSSFYE